MLSPLIGRLAGHYVGRRPLQSVLYILGVALGVAVVIAIDIANSSAQRAFNLSAESVSGRTTHQIIGGPSGLPTDLYRQLRLELGLRSIAPVIEEYVSSSDLGDQPLLLLGVDTFAEPPFRNYLTNVLADSGEDIAIEALYRFLGEPNTILISSALAERYDVQPGEALKLRPRGQEAEVHVVGVIQAQDDVSAQALNNLIVTDIATAQELVGHPGTISRIDMILPPDYDLALIRARLPDGATLTSPTEQSSAIRQLTSAFELNLQALSLLALVVGLFLIYNTVTFSVVQRRPVIGILRALGMTRAQVFSLILNEAVLLGLVGVGIGLALGIVLGRASVGLVAQTISDLYYAVDVQRVAVAPLTLLKGAAIGLFASLFAALIPSIEATRTAPVGTLRRSESERSTRRLLPFISLAAGGIVVMGIVLLALPTTDIIIAFVALFVIVIGGALLTPLMLLMIMSALIPLNQRLFGILGRMASRAVTRSLSRTSVAVAALTVAVSVIVGVSVMIASFRNTVADWLDNTLGADVYISPVSVSGTRVTADVERSVIDAVQAVNGVARISAGRGVSVIAPDYPELPPVNLTIANGEVTERRGFAWLAVDRARYWQGLVDGAIMVSEPFAFRRGITPERNSLTLLTDRGEKTFEVIGVFYDYAADQGTVFMADNIYRQFYDDPYISSMAVFLEPGVDENKALEDIRTVLAGSNLNARSNQALRTEGFDIFERAFSITIALRLLATVVAFIGILSALMSLQLEDTRQYGIMRAVGMTPRQLWRYTLIQTGLMGIAAGILAVPLGIVLAMVLIFVINVRSFGWTMQLLLTPGEVLSALAVAVVAALLAGVYPAYKLAKLVPVRALRSE